MMAFHEPTLGRLCARLKRAAMSPRYTFEQALQVLEIDASAGPRNAKRALMIQLQRHGPEPSPEDYARFNAAYDVLKEPSVWPDYTPPERYDDDLLTRPSRRLPPGHRRSARERPPTGRPTPPADHAWGDPAPAPTPPQGREDNPFLTDEPAPAEGQAPARPDAANKLLEDEAVVMALTRLEKNYGAVLSRDEVMQHMASGKPDELTAFLFDLFARGQVLATGAAVSALLDLMCGDQDHEFLHSRGVVKLLLSVFSTSDSDVQAISVGSSMQRAYDRWATASELNPPSLDISTRDGLRITRSLAALPEEFPPTLLAATARAAQRGDLSAVRADFESWIDAYDEQADEVRRILARSAPALYQAVHDIFPDRDSQEALNHAASARKRKLAVRVVIVALLAGAGWYATQEDAFESEARKELLEAKRSICDYAGLDHAACTLGRALTDALPGGDCTVIEPIVPKFVASVQSMRNNTGGMAAAVDLGELNTLKGKADKLVIAAQGKCPGI